MSLRLLEPVQRELDEAVAWYAAQAPGLGDAFLVETLRIFALIERYPEAWHPLGEHTRRCQLSRFPYGVIYAREGTESISVAIAHLHRRPCYWRNRFKEQNP
ncbi:MAG: type II toxin-antitoxin system RelE/ParE family toxin [Rudaea sp.]